MYTQNGNRTRNVEAVITRTVWPDWIAELEAALGRATLDIEFLKRCCKRANISLP